jgi:eukaryotic-like serine/threonine-protein kinase
MGTNATDRTLAGRYVLRSTLGRGGMAVVWRAEDLVLRREVAVKEVHLPEPLSPEERAATKARVLREARAAGKLSHPGAVTIYDVVEEDDVPFIVMELVDAPTLLDVVRGDGPIAVERAAEIGLEVMGVLEVAHSHGIVHRDVKPANVIVPPGGRAKLADFGIATSKDDTRVTSTGLVFGSPAFMSPEQACGAMSSPASDLWGLGATLYYAVEGAPPFERGGGPIPLLAAIVEDAPRPPERAGPLAPVILALLAKSPEERPRGEALRRPLRDLLWGAPQEGDGDTASARQRDQERTVRRHAVWGGTEPSPASDRAEPGERKVVEPPAPVSGSTARPLEREAEPHRATEAGAGSATEPTASGAQPGRSIAASSPTHPGRAPGRSAGRRWWPPVAAAALAAAVAAVLFFMTREAPQPAAAGRGTAGSRPGSGSENGGQGERGGPGADTDAGDASPTDPGDDSGTEVDTGTTADPGSVTVPRRWTEYTIGDTGFAISYPRRWDVVPIDDTRIDFRDPASSTYLRLDWTDTPGDDPAAAWEDLSDSFGASHDAYTEIRIDPTTFKGYDAAEWEFTYSEGGADLHAIDLGFVTGEYGFALNFQTAEQDWDSSQTHFERLKAAFTPPGG